MSGRKSWEVANVLSQTEDIQKDIFNSYEKEINSDIDDIDDNNPKIEIKIDTTNLKQKLNSIKDEILKQNKKAQEIRNKIKNASHYVDKEYSEAQNIKKSIAKLKKDFITLKNQVNNLKNKSFQELLERKKYIKTLIDNTKNRNKKEVILVEELADGNDTKITKLSYFDTYKNTAYQKEFDKFINSALEAYNNNTFDKAEKFIEKANKLFEEVSQKTDTLRENIEASANLALKIRDIMLDEINFSEAYVDIIDGNPDKGFRVSCKNGDTINFEEIRFDEDGNLIVNLDHIENTSGSCGVRWKDMQKAFNEHGIPLTDVKKNGNSVIYSKTKIRTTVSQNKRSRG